MAYRFEPGQPTAREFHRIAAEELDATLDLVSDSKQELDHRVHEARKHLKKLRALFALIAGAAERKAVDRTTDRVRRAARAVADLRGKAALIEAFDSLRDASAPVLAGAPAERIRRNLEAAKQTGSADVEALRKAEALLRRAREQLDSIVVNGSGWDCLEVGFRRTYARARRAGLEARQCPEADRLHQFRTPAKRHFYQVQLLEPLWPELLHAQRRELSRLGDLLGNHHDLCLLDAELRGGALEPDVGEVREVLQSRSAEIESAAFALSARLFAEKPRAIAARFRRYFAAST